MPENLCLSVSKHPCNTRHWWPTRLQRDLCFSNMQLGIIQLWYKPTKHSIYNGACLFPPHFFTIFWQYDHQTCQQFNTHTHTHPCSISTFPRMDPQAPSFWLGAGPWVAQYRLASVGASTTRCHCHPHGSHSSPGVGTGLQG